MCIINQLSFGFYDIPLLGHPSRGCSQPKKNGVPDAKTTKPCQCQQRSAITDQGLPNHLSNFDSFVVSLGGPEKGPVQVSLFLIDYLLNDFL